ncbi:SEC-C domain-containing protein, partial [Candidatus Peregrinibacteria bacterium]|nr:SEC-C domain-containing protein [Candidatus Peregrinibacteria bacterium]
LAGMTGTADTEAEEFYQIYGLDTIVIPTNKAVARIDSTDVIYKTQKGKYMAIVQKIKELNKEGQPVLVGTISVEKSEVLSKLLSIEGIKHNVLNAKQHEREAEIVTNAGEKAAVTIATNMAGRGTDIKLGEGVQDVGGLYVLGTERHESRRIDNQLRGRSGRQGDPGASQFFVSMEDELMRLFGADRIKNMMNILKVPEDMPIQNSLISRSIESAQKKVEGRNFDIRKHLVEYDDVMNIHRTVIYKRRRKFLEKEDNKEDIQEMIRETAEAIVRNHTEARHQQEWNYHDIFEAISAIHSGSLNLEELESIKNQNELVEKCQNYLLQAYDEKEGDLPEPAIMRHVERAVFLRANDTLWMEHIDAMSRLRENVAFSGYAQKDPLTEYRSQGYEMFLELVGMIRANTVNTLFKIKPAQVVPAQMLARSQIRNMQTNEEEVEAGLTGNKGPILNTEARNKRLEEAGIKIRTVNDTSVTHSTLDEEETASSSIDHTKVGRNDPCPCGSGKKYKKCHG